MTELAIKTAAPQDVEIVAAKAVAHGNLKDHQNWELIGKLAAELKDPEKSLVKAAYDKIKDQENEHFYHNQGMGTGDRHGNCGRRRLASRP